MGVDAIHLVRREYVDLTHRLTPAGLRHRWLQERAILLVRRRAECDERTDLDGHQLRELLLDTDRELRSIWQELPTVGEPWYSTQAELPLRGHRPLQLAHVARRPQESEQ
jgi:hypothetical protein